MYHIRQEKMNRLIQERDTISIKELQALFPEVSLMTVHRDLSALEAAGFILKVRGGARRVRHDRDLTFAFREQENLAGKTKIAEKAAALIRDESCIFIDSGTTCLALARLIPPTVRTVVTTGPNIALALARVAGPGVTLCPGNLNKENLTVSGHSTLQFLETINIDLAFIGVSGYAKGEGFTCGQESEMMVKRQAIKRARRTALLCDRTKFHRLMPFTFAAFADIDYLISDETPTEDFLQSAEAAGIAVL